MWTISEQKEWEFLLRFSWVSDMRGVLQSPVHHAEGDVETHTRMVIAALESLPEYGALDQQGREILWAAALLHDVEKRSTTQIDENGNITSPGHAKKGAMTARSILYREIATPFALREQIVGLVRHHGLPLWALEKTDPVKAVLKASYEVNTEHVALLAKADVLGRVCSDREDLLYKIELFRELCIEQDCWGKPKAFPSDLSRFRYFRSDDLAPGFEPFDDTRTEVVLLSGIAGSGKDFYLKKHFPEMAVIALDDLRRRYKISHRDSQGNGRIIQECKEQAREYMRKQIPFVWNATNITIQMRDQLIDLFTIYNARVRVVYLEAPYRKLLTQNRNRDYPIPESAIDKMVGKLEVPKAWEAHRVEYVVA